MHVRNTSKFNAVSPYTGEWIEISTIDNNSFNCKVSPYTGEWIEIVLLIPNH